MGYVISMRINLNRGHGGFGWLVLGYLNFGYEDLWFRKANRLGVCFVNREIAVKKCLKIHSCTKDSPRLDKGFRMVHDKPAMGQTQQRQFAQNDMGRL